MIKKSTFSKLRRKFDIVNLRAKEKIQKDRLKLKTEFNCSKIFHDMLESYQKNLAQFLKSMSVNCVEIKNTALAEINRNKNENYMDAAYGLCEKFISDLLKPLCNISLNSFFSVKTLVDEAKIQKKLVLKHFDLVANEVKQSFLTYDEVLRSYQAQLCGNVHNESLLLSSNRSSSDSVIGKKCLFPQAEKLKRISESYDYYVTFDIPAIVSITVKKIIADGMNGMYNAYNEIFGSAIKLETLSENDLFIDPEKSPKFITTLSDITADISSQLEQVVYFINNEHYKNTLKQLKVLHKKLKEVDYNKQFTNSLKSNFFGKETTDIKTTERFFEEELIRFKTIVTMHTSEVMVATIKNHFKFIDETQTIKDLNFVLSKKYYFKNVKVFKATISRTFITNTKSFISVNKNDSVEIFETDGKGNAKIITQNGEKGYVPFAILNMENEEQEKIFISFELKNQKNISKNKSFSQMAFPGTIIYNETKSPACMPKFLLNKNSTYEQSHNSVSRSFRKESSTPPEALYVLPNELVCKSQSITSAVDEVKYILPYSAEVLREPTKIINKDPVLNKKISDECFEESAYEIPDSEKTKLSENNTTIPEENEYELPDSARKQLTEIKKSITEENLYDIPQSSGEKDLLMSEEENIYDELGVIEISNLKSKSPKKKAKGYSSWSINKLLSFQKKNQSKNKTTQVSIDDTVNEQKVINFNNVGDNLNLNSIKQIETNTKEDDSKNTIQNTDKQQNRVVTYEHAKHEEPKDSTIRNKQNLIMNKMKLNNSDKSKNSTDSFDQIEEYKCRESSIQFKNVADEMKSKLNNLIEEYNMNYTTKVTGQQKKKKTFSSMKNI